jgi:CheY-like chemotaxis protein
MRPLDPAFELGSRLAAMEPAARLDFAMLAHDIRGALQGVLGGLAAIGAEDLPAEAREQLQRIGAAARSIESLSDGLAGLNREAGVIARPAREDVVIQEFLGYYRNRWAGEARSKGIGFEVAAAGDLPAGLRVSHLPLARVLGNLTYNAITHAGRGTLRLEVMRSDRGGVVFRLTDEGPGLSAEALRRMSARDAGEIYTNEAGHGLGLHIVRKLSHEIGGRVSVRDRDEGGVQAVLEFPAAFCIEAVQAPRPAAVRNRTELAGLRILLAEDNPTNQMVATQMLTMLKADVTLASDGVEALERFEEAAFDLVVVDIEMPRLTGLDVIRTIRARRDGRATTPIVALTAYALREHRDRIAEAGANGLISKPITSIDALAKGLAGHVNAYSAAPASRGAEPEAAEAPEGPVIDRAIYEALATAIGAEMMSELLEKVAADLTGARDELSSALDPLDCAPIRAASHILISVAGAVGAVRLQRCAKLLNTAATAGELAAVTGLVPVCVAEIDAAVAFTDAERAGA